MLWCLCCLCMEFYRKANSFLLPALWQTETFLIRFEEFKAPKGPLCSLWKEFYCLRICSIRLHLCSASWHIPSTKVTGYLKSSSSLAWKKEKWKKNNQCGFQVILLLVGLWQLECSQGWAGLHLAPLSVRVCPGLSEHVRGLLRCSAALCHHKIRITKGAFRGTRGGFWRNGATGKSSEAFLKWLTPTQQEHAAVQRRLRVSSHVPRSYCARFMTTERSCLINILSFSSSWDVLHCFSVLFFSLSTPGAFLAFMWQTC